MFTINKKSDRMILLVKNKLIGILSEDFSYISHINYTNLKSIKYKDINLILEFIKNEKLEQMVLESK